MQPVDRLESDIQGGVDPDRDLGSVEIVVDGGGHADHGKAHLRQVMGARLRPVSANHDEAVDVAPLQRVKGPFEPRLRVELGTPGTSQHRPAPLHDAAHVARSERRHVVCEQAGVAVVDAEDPPPPVQTGSHDRPDGGVHSGGVTATGEHGDLLHGGSPWVRPLPGGSLSPERSKRCRRPSGRPTQSPA